MGTPGLLEHWTKRIRRPSLSAPAIVEKSSPAQSRPQGLRSKQTADRSCPLLSLATRCERPTGRRAGKHLKISRDGLELAHHRTRRLASPVGGHVEAMIHVIMDQLPFCLRNGLLNGVKLLGKVKTWAAFLEHRDDSPNVPFGPLEPLDNIRMTFMDGRFCLHLICPILWVRICQAHGPADKRCVGTYLRALIYPIPRDTISASKSVLRSTIFVYSCEAGSAVRGKSCAIRRQPKSTEPERHTHRASRPSPGVHRLVLGRRCGVDSRIVGCCLRSDVPRIPCVGE